MTEPPVADTSLSASSPWVPTVAISIVVTSEKAERMCEATMLRGACDATIKASDVPA